MFKKSKIIISNFFSTIRLKEFIELILIPVIISVLFYLLTSSKINNMQKFINEFNDSILTITALLATFGLSSLTIILTVSNENISKAKQTYIDRRDSKGKKITYYKLLVLRGFYSLFVQVILLFFSITCKFIIAMHSFKILLYIELGLLLIAVFAQIFVVISLYYLFSPNKA